MLNWFVFEQGIISSLKDIPYELQVDDLSEPWNECIGLVQETSWPPVVSQGHHVVVLCLKPIQSIDKTFLPVVRSINTHYRFVVDTMYVTSHICEYSDYRLVWRAPQSSKDDSRWHNLIRFVAESLTLPSDPKHIRQIWRTDEGIGWTIYSYDRPLSPSTRP